jgi:hypothetical protein
MNTRFAGLHADIHPLVVDETDGLGTLEWPIA